MDRILIKKSELEPAANNLAAWLQSVRLGLLSSRIGMVKGIIAPLAEGVYHDRDALIDTHAVWDQTGEGDDAIFSRRMKEYLVNGQKVGEEVIFKDPREFQKAVREMMAVDITVDVPFLFEEKDIKEAAGLAPKSGKELPTVDFGALRCLFKTTARFAPADQ